MTAAYKRKSQCDGKMRHATRTEANWYKWFMSDKRPGEKFTVYLCPHCKWFHVGHLVTAKSR